MKIEVNISEFYLNEDQSIEEGLAEYIKKDVIKQISEKIKIQVDNEITSYIIKNTEETLKTKISEAVIDNIKNGKTKSKKNSNELVSIEEYVRECYENHGSAWTSFESVIKKVASDFSTEIKKRYDLLFASQIVIKMGENGLLKNEDISKLIDFKK